jgi:hypothetical protein
MKFTVIVAILYFFAVAIRLGGKRFLTYKPQRTQRKRGREEERKRREGVAWGGFIM